MMSLLNTPLSLEHILILAAVLFTIGVCGIFLCRKNVITLLMSIELMLLAVNINLVGFSIFHHHSAGQIMTLFVLTVAAAEAAIGLAILVAYYRLHGSVEVTDIHQLRG
jgi:NADH-quinone oxidoreductase subunit K